MEGYTVSSGDGSQAQASSNATEETDFQPLDLPMELRLKESREQLQYLLLASLVLLYRSSNGSESATFTWGHYEDSTPVTQVSARLKEVISGPEVIVSDMSQTIRSLSERKNDNREETKKASEEKHMFFAASHATGQAAPNVSICAE